MKDDFPEVLKSIENVLVAGKATVTESLQAAYRMGKLDGMLEILVDVEKKENESKVRDGTRGEDAPVWGI